MMKVTISTMLSIGLTLSLIPCSFAFGWDTFDSPSNKLVPMESLGSYTDDEQDRAENVDFPPEYVYDGHQGYQRGSGDQTQGFYGDIPQQFGDFDFGNFYDDHSGTNETNQNPEQSLYVGNEVDQGSNLQGKQQTYPQSGQYGTLEQLVGFNTETQNQELSPFEDTLFDQLKKLHEGDQEQQKKKLKQTVEYFDEQFSDLSLPSLDFSALESELAPEGYDSGPSTNFNEGYPPQNAWYPSAFAGSSSTYPDFQPDFSTHASGSGFAIDETFFPTSVPPFHDTGVSMAPLSNALDLYDASGSAFNTSPFPQQMSQHELNPVDPFNNSLYGTTGAQGAQPSTVVDLVDDDDDDDDVYVFDPSSCMINVKKLPHRHGLILDFETEEFLYPTSGSVIEVKNGSSFRIACVSSFKAPHFTQNYSGVSNASTIRTVTCIDGKLYADFRGYPRKPQLLDENDYECTAMPRPVLQSAGQGHKSQLCNRNTAHYQMGFRLQPKSSSKFLIMYDICVSAYKLSFIKKTFNSPSLKYQEQKKQQAFFPDYLFRSKDDSKTMDDLYKPESYIPYIQRTIGEAALADIFMKTDGSHHTLVPAQMFDENDFVYESEQLSAMLYVGVQPMWSNVYYNNWLSAKAQVQSYIESSSTPIDVYAGTSGVMQYRNYTKGTLVNLYLGKLSENARYGLRIPNLFYMIVHDRSREASVVIVFHNTTVESRPVCKSVNEHIRWLSLQNTKELGMAYACRYDSFLNSQSRENKPMIPVIPNVNLLV